MSEEAPRGGRLGDVRRSPYRVRLPGFVSDEPIGLGDIIKRVTYTAGIEPCGGCERRAEALNNWLVFSPWRPPR